MQISQDFNEKDDKFSFDLWDIENGTEKDRLIINAVEGVIAYYETCLLNGIKPNPDTIRIEAKKQLYQIMHTDSH